MSDPRPAAGWGRGGTGHAHPRSAADPPGVGGGTRTAEAGRRGRAGRTPRPFSGGLTARRVPRAAVAVLCNGDLPSPSSMARPAGPLTGPPAEAPRDYWCPRPCPPRPAADASRPHSDCAANSLSCAGASPAIQRRAIHWCARWVAGSWSSAGCRRGPSAVFSAVSRHYVSSPLPLYQTPPPHWIPESGSEFPKAPFIHLFFLVTYLLPSCEGHLSSPVRTRVPFILALTVETSQPNYRRKGTFPYVVRCSYYLNPACKEIP